MQCPAQSNYRLKADGLCQARPASGTALRGEVRWPRLLAAPARPGSLPLSEGCLPKASGAPPKARPLITGPACSVSREALEPQNAVDDMVHSTLQRCAVQDMVPLRQLDNLEIYLGVDGTAEE